MIKLLKGDDMNRMRLLAIAAACLAVALALGPSWAHAGEWTRDSAGNMLVPPAPAPAASETKRLFSQIEEAKDSACPKKEEDIKHYIMSESDLKSGNVKLLVGGLPQAFSDAWRQRLHMKPIAVSSVVAQPLDLSRLGGGAALDVTEFGADGCAFSRTIMPAPIWGDILRAAIGVGV